jgi:hypothetical protein
MTKKIPHQITLSILVVILIGFAVSILFYKYELIKKPDPNKNTNSSAYTQPDTNGVTISKNSQMKAGIESGPLQGISYRQKIRAYGTVIGMQYLTELKNKLAAAQAKVDEAKANLTASQENYIRQQNLYKEEQSSSQKSLQQAEALWLSDKAALEAAQSNLSSQEAIIDQEWGKVIGKWLKENSEPFIRLMDREDVLIQITIPPDTPIESMSENALIETADGNTVEASFVSESPRTEPRIQGLSFFYLASEKTTGLLTDMNIMAYLQSKSEVTGVYVPDSAVVRWQGKSWIYLQTGPENFVRHEINTVTGVKKGWFIEKGLSEGQWCVICGTQLVLSEQLRNETRGGTED